LLEEDERASLGTAATRCTDPAEIADPNVVKVVLDKEGFAMYFSRAPIPYLRDKWPSLEDVGAGGPEFLRHIGIYSYRREALLRLTELEPTRLEQTEKLEQLRAMEHGMRIKVGITDFEIHGVDTPEDLVRVSELYKKPQGKAAGQ
ncbi:hypothetical protein LCGC14_2157690, partial [marine sediment metagenome]